MKKLLPILFVLIITSCSKEIPSDQLVERDGVYYEVNSQTGFTGTSISYYGNGQLEEKITYKNGKRHGNQEMYFKNGRLNIKSTYKKNQIHGNYEQYYENGQLEIKGTSNEGRVDQKYESFHSNGQLMSSGMYNNGKQEGLHQGFHSKGQKWYLKNYKDGIVVDGVYEFFYENGKVDERVSIRDGKKNGSYEKFYQFGGELEKIQNYKNGLLDGVEEIYFKSGKVSERISYRDGKKNGPYKEFSHKGCLSSEDTYKNDEKILEEIYYSWNGDCSKTSKSKTQYFKNSLQHGISILFSDKGKPHMYRCYKEGKEIKNSYQSRPGGLGTSEDQRKMWDRRMERILDSILDSSYCNKFL